MIWRNVFVGIFAICIAVSACIMADSEVTQEPIQLFDGESLDGWTVHHVGDADVEGVWVVEDGILKTVGEPFGYLYTETPYESYKLVIEWRWPEDAEPSNSGVLLRIAEEPVTFLTKCIEAQLMHGNVGDIWAFYGAKLAESEERYTEIENHHALGDFVGIRKIKDAELPPGEWNTYEIALYGADLTLGLNGELVNQATGLEVHAGSIGFQSEGGPIEFRKVELTPID